MRVRKLNRWDVTLAEAKEIQLQLRDELVLRPPPGFTPLKIAGADLSIARHSHRGYAGLVVIDAATMETMAESSAAADVDLPYIPGYLSFRELPVLVAAWERLHTRPDAIIFDGHGIAHPRRFGIACHGGLIFDTPSVGCGKSILVGRHGPLGQERGSTAELVHKGEVIGMAVRTRCGVKPVYVSPGYLMDLPTAVALVLGMSTRFREPETTRRSHRLVNAVRLADQRAAGEG
jgi:deoxyribonuclease V